MARFAVLLLAAAVLRAGPSRAESPDGRLRAAMKRAEANEAEAIPVLIDLLAKLPADKRQSVEEFLTQLGGEWAPRVQFQSDDEVSRRIRRAAWLGWWRRTDGPVLLAALDKHTLSPTNRKRIQGFLDGLGSDEFAARENATKELFSMGRITLPQLREAAKSRDPEVSRRATSLIERIEKEPPGHLPLAAIRLLPMRKPAGAVEALLAYLPHAEDATYVAAVQQSLGALAQHDAKPHPALLRSLADARPLMRGTVAAALAQGCGPQGRAAARKLLTDEAPAARWRVALALAKAGEREAVPVLIDLLALLPVEEALQVDSALYRLAGETAPKVSPGDNPDENKKCRGAWAGWWKSNDKKVDLARLSTQPMLGYTLICDVTRNRVFEVDRHGQTRWSFDVAGGPVDVALLPGNRVLIAEWSSRRVTERDLKGNVLWEKAGLDNHASTVQRLPNGNTLIAVQDQHILEVDRSGRELYRVHHQGGILGAYRTREGVIVSRDRYNRCIFLDTTGRQLRSFEGQPPNNYYHCFELAPNGSLFLPCDPKNNKVVEYDSSGKVLREASLPGVTMASGLPNGHILGVERLAQRVVELDRGGKVVWEYKMAGQPCRARRR